MGEAATYRKKPVTVEARQWFCKGHLPTWAQKAGTEYAECVLIETLEGVMRAEPGDWIIRGIKGEVYSCKPDIFALTYEPA